MRVGPATRKPKNHQKYARHIKNKTDASCEFCKFDTKSEQVIAARGTMFLVKNIFGYDIWDENDVTDHLMIVPKRHVVSLSELTDKERKTFMELVAEYESQGYSLYARAPQNIIKSVVHQHTHLIKLGQKRKKFHFFLRKPHILLYK